MPDLPILAQRLRELRLRTGMTQEQFAEAAGISYKFYQQIEAARKKQIWLETVERIAAGFGLETWQLLGPESPEKLIAAESEQAEYGKKKASAPKPGKSPRERKRQS